MVFFSPAYTQHIEDTTPYNVNATIYNLVYFKIQAENILIRRFLTF
jgi:hypothetical protein